jgi:PTH1 family peptidyl-tRNA hydrolase
MKLIIGLGNPGPRYVFTRHNVGFLYVDRIVEKFKFKKIKTTKLYESFMGEIEGKSVILAKPMTFMNLSGLAVKDLLFSNDLLPEDMLLVYDDIWLNLGRIRIRKKGSAGGHNGLKSVINYINTEFFKRIRIGIGPLSDNEDLIGYVLGEFSNDDLQILWKVIDKSIEATADILKNSIDKVMNNYNGEIL